MDGVTKLNVGATAWSGPDAVPVANDRPADPDRASASRRSGPQGDWQAFSKRALDIVLVLLIVPLILPSLLISALAIKLESRGPVLFSQLRYGINGRPTRIFKLRTMYADRCDAAGVVHTSARDGRVTRVGRLLRRTSIDELPQLLNVLRGDMSLVGPRPHAVQMQVQGRAYEDAVRDYHLRHRVRPGLTGWAQINGSRGAIDTLPKAEQRVELDLWYIENWSLGLDLRIILRTAFGGFMSLRAD